MYKHCTTSRSIARQRQVASNMIEMIEKVPYSRVTVSSLCQASDISRNVFYKYFGGIDGVFEFISDSVRVDLEQKVFNQEGVSFSDEALRFFQYWYQHREFLSILVKNNLLELLFTCFISHSNIRRLSLEQMTDEIPRDLFPLVADFSIYGIISMLLNWHRQNYQASPEELADAASRLLTTPLYKSQRGDNC